MIFDVLEIQVAARRDAKTGLAHTLVLNRLRLITDKGRAFECH